MNYFAYARTALKFGLGLLELSPGDRVLVPNYVCEAVLQPMRDLLLEPIYYPVEDSLEPNWEVLNAISLEKSCRAILMIHYFGQPQNVRRFQQFCLRHGLYLIEDNAHGFGGALGGKLLGTFGDVGISSPRKILGIQHGGILYVDGKIRLPPNLQCAKSENLHIILRSLFESFPSSKVWALKITNRLPNFEDPYFFQEPSVDDALANRVATKKITKIVDGPNLGDVARQRRTNWGIWSNLVRERGWEPVYERVNEESSPWMFPVYVDSPIDRSELISRGLKRGFVFAPWPTLPREVASREERVVDRWRRLVCFPLDRAPLREQFF